jgi:cellulose synthase/poly-beta-1,6-N-acetylglucosamine synthase-like glycosyltransferase
MGQTTIAAIIIGRNEGERLRRCLESVLPSVDRAIYVDSGSTDESIAIARAAGAEIVQLEMDKPFTAARARNAGLAVLRAGDLPDYVQFIDGDCELRPDWVPFARSFLDAHPRVAIACGRRRERFPEASVYNRLCDREWNTPVGLAKACGGDALARMVALDQVGGYNPTLIAGEEPEMCVRLRQKGWEIWRLDAEMTLHDAAITRFSQWWKRMRRGGHAAAEGMAMHGAPPERHGVATVTRTVFWAGALPVTTLAGLALLGTPAALLLLAYPLQVIRLSLRQGGGAADWEEAFFLTVGKFAELAGMLDYWRGRLMRSPSAIIEYKS